MSNENVSQVDEKCCLDDLKPMKTIEETSLDVPLLPDAVAKVNPRRFSTGALDKKGPCKAHVQTRYRGNQSSSTHDLCKHGKRREEDELVIKPWKLVKKKNVEGETLVRKSLGNVTKPEKPLEADAKKDYGLVRVKRSETKSATTTPPPPKGSSIVRKVTKTNLDVNKVSRSSESKSDAALKNLKCKEKMKIDEPVIKCEDVMEKTLYVVESSVEEKEKKTKKILRGSGKKSLIPSLSPSTKEIKESVVTRSDPRPIRQATSSTKTSLSEKKKIGSVNLVTESKIRPKRIGLKVTPPPHPPPFQTSFKKGKVLEPKQEESAPKMIKFKKRVVQEPKQRSDVSKKKKSLKDKREGVWRMNGEGKREKVVLRHRKVEVKKKLQTLFNNVIEETVNKLGEAKKVKALVGAFETVISLQDNDKTHPKKKMQSKTMSSQVLEG